MVAKGFLQVFGQDFTESFAPVAKVVTARILLTIAAKNRWVVHQLDINNAFLHGSLKEDVYLLPPQGFNAPPGQVCKLNKALYGLRQAPRQWYKHFTSKLKEFGFSQSSYDHCMFHIHSDITYIVLIIYVDDVLITGNDEELITRIKKFLDTEFTIKDLGKTDYFLGVEIDQSTEDIMVSQMKYIVDILQEYHMMDSKPCATPILAGSKLSSTEGKKMEKPKNYRRLVGRLLYLTMTRPDFTFAVQQLSQFMASPTFSHWKAAQRLLRYLRGTLHYKLIFPHKGELNLEAHCDADWGCCLKTRKSLSNYCIYLGSCLISWKTKKQTTISRSSAEAEYRSLATTVAEILWITYILRDFKVQLSMPINLYCDNVSAIHMMENPVHHDRTKHVDIDCHFVRDYYSKGLIKPVYIKSKDQVTDAFTKALSVADLHKFISKLNIGP